jgi:hypothetical protein
MEVDVSGIGDKRSSKVYERHIKGIKLLKLVRNTEQLIDSNILQINNPQKSN